MEMIMMIMMMMMMMMIIIIIINYRNSTIGHCTHTSESTNVKLQ